MSKTDYKVRGEIQINHQKIGYCDFVKSIGYYHIECNINDHNHINKILQKSSGVAHLRWK